MTQIDADLRLNKNPRHPRYPRLNIIFILQYNVQSSVPYPVLPKQS